MRLKSEIRSTPKAFGASPKSENEDFCPQNTQNTQKRKTEKTVPSFPFSAYSAGKSLPKSPRQARGPSWSKAAIHKSGFSLVEVMCAILILGVALVGLTQGIT